MIIHTIETIHIKRTNVNVYRVSWSILSYMAMQLQHCTYKITTSCRTLMELLMKNCVKEVGIKFFFYCLKGPQNSFDLQWKSFSAIRRGAYLPSYLDRKLIEPILCRFRINMWKVFSTIVIMGILFFVLVETNIQRV